MTNEAAFPGAEDDDADPVAAAELALAEAPKTENGAKRRVKLSAWPAELLSDVAQRPGSATIGSITDDAEPDGPGLADPEAEAPFAAAGAAAAAPGLAEGARWGAPCFGREGGMFQRYSTQTPLAALSPGSSKDGSCMQSDVGTATMLNE